MKTKEALNALKEEAKKEAKPEEKGGVLLMDEDLEQVSGGFKIYPRCKNCGAFHPADQPCPKPLI